MQAFFALNGVDSLPFLPVLARSWQKDHRGEIIKDKRRIRYNTGKMTFRLVFSSICAIALATCLQAQNTPSTIPPSTSPDSTKQIQGKSNSVAALQDSKELEVLESHLPIFPRGIIPQPPKGSILLRIHASPKGTVERVEYLRGDPHLKEPSICAARGWKFKPFIRNGQHIPVATDISPDVVFFTPLGKNNLAYDEAALVAARETRHGSSVTGGELVHKVAPDYPLIAQSARVQGSVVLHAIITETGTIGYLDYVSGNPMLIENAIVAVSQWRYKPYVVDGKPVPVDTEITVNFFLGSARLP
jgi:TonB family protein